MSLNRLLNKKLSWYWQTSATRLEVSQGHQTRHHVRYRFQLVCYSNFVRKMHRFFRYPIYSDLETRFRVTYNFLLTFHSKYEPISYRFRDKWWFPSEIAKFSHLVYFAPPLSGFPLELGIGARSKQLEWWGCQKVKKTFEIGSAI